VLRPFFLPLFTNVLKGVFSEVHWGAVLVVLRAVEHSGAFWGFSLLFQLFLRYAIGLTQVDTAQVGTAQIGTTQIRTAQFGSF
jgi:hypothetical protein